MKEFYEMSFLTRMKKSGKQKRRGRRENTIPPIVPKAKEYQKFPSEESIRKGNSPTGSARRKELRERGFSSTQENALIKKGLIKLFNEILFLPF